MFEDLKKQIISKIDDFCLQRNLPTGKVEFRNIPFSGEWGMAAPFFPLAAADLNKTLPVPLHAQALAEELKEIIGLPEGFTRSEAVKGYLNLYFDTGIQRNQGQNNHVEISHHDCFALGFAVAVFFIFSGNLFD